ncbi:hypothetical protein H4R26_002950 [Coemansia thaxteri]|uniref:AB hydrolase-1 domain-containing protein n=1 Tax=Coemansia thaxteri TaxID=2663907 RepID=A0A9W8BJ28_9FUNG|nr:hypothetical protein H4R26_002950 [Coemansia thaxteri]KAJ2478111.1 hypothetical protein EV174_004411 [Coemansia sp. RSA 2320]
MWYFRKHTIFSVPGIVLVLLTLAYFVAFFVYIGVSARRNRLVKHNEFAYMWIALVGLLLGLQSLFVISAYRASSRYLYWTLPWMGYGALMCVFSLCATGGYGAIGDGASAAWSIFWLVPGVAIFVYAAKARRGYAVDRIMGIPEYRPRLANSRGMVLFYVALDNVFPWLTWLTCVFFGLLVVIQALCLANDYRIYERPGTLVPIQTNGGEDWYNLHVWCYGYGADVQAKGTAPVFVLLTDFGMPSTSMMGLAQGFANSGHPACIVDRPGYGWSEPGYWNQNPSDVVKSINQALTKYPISNPIVLVGWGDGGVWSQLYMQEADYSRVIGVVLLDTHPNLEILQTYALNRTTTLQNLRQLRSISTSGSVSNSIPEVHFDESVEQQASQLFANWRAVSPIALHRARNNAWPGFSPQDSLGMHRSLFRNNLYYQAKYFEYGGTGAKLYQSLLGYVVSATDAVLVYHHWPLRWPSFRDGSGSAFLSTSSLTRRDGAPPTAPASNTKIPVIIIASAKQFDSNCQTQGISNKEDCTKWQAFAWFYYRQQIEYQQTLSQNAALLLCTAPVQEDNKPCDTDFVWTRPNWLAAAIAKNVFTGSSAANFSSSTPSSSPLAATTTSLPTTSPGSSALPSPSSLLS